MTVTQTGAAYFWANLKDQLRMAFEGTTINITHGGPKKPYAQVAFLQADTAEIKALAMGEINQSSYTGMRKALNDNGRIYISDRENYPNGVVKITRVRSF